MPARQVGGYQVVIDPQEWYRLKKELDKFDPSLSRALRKRIRNAGVVAVDAVKEELAKSSPDNGSDSGEGREALAAATKVSVSFGKRSAGAKIVTSSRLLPDEHKGLLKVYNKESFRHPVFGQPNWVTQKGRPYFGKPIQKAIDRELTKEIRAALDEAVKAIGGKGK